MLQRPDVHRVTYVDAFAGPGEYSTGEEESPAFAIHRLLNHDAKDRMNLRRNRVVVTFIEDDGNASSTAGDCCRAASEHWMSYRSK
jgi:hypothetical protein